MKTERGNNNNNTDTDRTIIKNNNNNKHIYNIHVQSMYCRKYHYTWHLILYRRVHK